MRKSLNKRKDDFELQQIDFSSLTTENHRGRKPNLYMVLDCETASLPFLKSMGLTPKQRQKVSIAMPLIYDIGWRIIDRKGNVYGQHSFLITETFFVPQIFDTAYYRDKRPQYEEKFANGEIVEKTWNQAMEILEHDLQYVDYVCAYNALFDFKKAINFTEDYIQALRKPNYQKWEDGKRRFAEKIANGYKSQPNPEFDHDHFNFRGKDYPLICLWRASAEKLINNHKYKENCIKNHRFTVTGLYFKTSAEVTFQYLSENYGFVESHTAFEDVEIECEILCKALAKGKLSIGIDQPSFQLLGQIPDYLLELDHQKGRKPKFSIEDYETITAQMFDYVQSEPVTNKFASHLYGKILKMEKLMQDKFDSINLHRYYKAKIYFTERDLRQAEKSLHASKKPETRESYFYKIKRLQNDLSFYKQELEKSLEN